MSHQLIDWSKRNIVKTSIGLECFDGTVDSNQWRKVIEPWLSTIFQSEHFSLLVGTGLTNAVAYLSGITPQDMSRIQFSHTYEDEIKKASDESSKAVGRGSANIEDDFRIAFELLKGLQILNNDADAESLKSEIDKKMLTFINNVLKVENEFKKLLIDQDDSVNAQARKALSYLNSFLLSFSSRAASRERLNLFTTNYDRFLEFSCDDVGIILLDRFKGKLQPVFRNTRLELDYHYNPPGIRGEPRYVEGVVRITKIHGSIDWRFKEHGNIIRSLISFGAETNHPENTTKPSDNVVIYPNSAKDIETAFYPYSELFRDFSTAICRPNSVLVIYGYGFGDSHINRIIEDMLTIPSTHLVIISFDDPGNRIQKFFTNKNADQFTLLVGNHFGSLEQLVDNYLPKSAIDRLTIRMNDLIGKRTTSIGASSPGTSTN